MPFGQTMRNLRRIKQIANVLFSNQLGYVVDRLNLRSTLSFRHRVSQSVKPVRSMPERLRSAMEELGGSFVKLGQLLSLRYDLLPKEYCDEFSKLQEGVKPFSYVQVKLIIESQLGKPIKDLFQELDPQPIAAASIGQVHKAVLKNGDLVAVKVQRPQIDTIFEADIDLLYHLARLMDKRIPELKQYNPIGIVQEFEKYTKRELDYLVEAKNIDLFYENFKDDQYVKIPKVYWNYTTSKVLTMEFINGHKISEVKQFSALKADKKKIVERVADAFTKQVLEYGVFHADPHPGNIFIVKDSEIAILDFGIVGKLTPELKDKIEEMLIAIVKKDVEMLSQSIVSIGIVNDSVDVDEFKDDLIDSFGDYYGTSLNQVNTLNFFFDALSLARKYNMKFPTSYVLLIKAMVTTQGFIKTLDPEFNFLQAITPSVERIMVQRARPKYLIDSMKKNMRNAKYMIGSFPKELSALMKSLKKGALVNVDIDNRDIKKLTHELDTSSNRMTFGMIILSLIIATALFMHADLEPKVFNIPVAAVISLAAMLFVAACLMISIVREQKGGDY